ncbi:unnamed protein product [Symbiodinium sp. CCMP2456]|nr:unnamed protein product [Symbiodinium sp. CCMP2456]
MDQVGAPDGSKGHGFMADTGISKGRLSAATTMLPEDRSTAMVSLASSVASKPPLEENLAMPMLERPSRPEPSRQEDTRSSIGSLVTNSSRPKVMLMTRGTRGDVQPFVALARGLILYHNCDVVLVTELLWKNFVKSAAEELPLPYQGRLRFRPCGGDTSRRVSGDMARFVLSLGQDSLALQALVFSRSEVEFFSSEGCFFHWAWEERPTFIVFGFLMIHVAMIISEALQIPIVGFILQPLREIEPTMERTALDELFGPLRRVFAGQKFNAVLQQVRPEDPRCIIGVSLHRSLRAGSIAQFSFRDVGVEVPDPKTPKQPKALSPQPHSPLHTTP